MKILIATIGSRGDVQPYINLAQGLLAVGHDVHIASNPTLSGLADSHRVPFLSVGHPVDMGFAILANGTDLDRECLMNLLAKMEW